MGFDSSQIRQSGSYAVPEKQAEKLFRQINLCIT
jgi:hypothetical protein